MENEKTKKRVALLLLIGSILLLFLLVPMLFEGTQDAETDEEIAFLRRYIPELSITNIRDSEDIEIGKALFSGDTLRTDNQGFAMILFVDESIARMKPNSQMIIRGQLSEDRSYNLRTEILLLLGGALFDVKKQDGSEFEISTGVTVGSVKGTRFGVNSDHFMWVEEGEVEASIASTGETFTLKEAMYIRIEEDGAVASGELTPEELAALSEEYSILESDLIEREMIMRFRNRSGEVFEEQLRIFEKD